MKSSARERFLVEIEASEIARVEQISMDAREAAGRLRARGLAVRFLRTVAVPEDGSCYQLWEAESREALLAALSVLGHSFREVSEVVGVESRSGRGDSRGG